MSEMKPSKPAKAPAQTDNNNSQIWSVVEKSRHPKRPHALDYIKEIFEDFEELSGDRSFKEDPALLGGLAKLKATQDSSPTRCLVLAHQKGRNTQQRVKRNFGMAHPEGYKKAIRLMDLAEKFSLPIISFIDTPGAFPGIEAEERGQSYAIATCTQKMLSTRTPSMGIVIGEGGSGGALAIGVPDRLLMLSNSTYSVISPESCASILWKDAKESKKAAQALQPHAESVKKLGICDEIITEPGKGAHENLAATSALILSKIHEHLIELQQLPLALLLEQRSQKYRQMGQCHTNE